MIVQYSKRAIKAIKHMDTTMAQRIRLAIEKLPAGDIVPLRGRDGAFRLRVGTWRVLYSLKERNIILVSKIAPRGEAYKGE